MLMKFNVQFVSRLLSGLMAAVLLAGCQSLPSQHTSSHSSPAEITSPADSGAGEEQSVPSDDKKDSSTSFGVVQPQVVHVRQPKIALVLGGGGARGFAHVGVIKVLEQYNIKPDLVIGTSAGSLVGALYAAGNDSAQLSRLAASMNEAVISDWSFPFFSGVTGLLKGEAIQAYVNRVINNKKIEQFKIPFIAVASDIQTGESALFSKGDAGLAVRASSAVPGLFQPVKIGQHEYVDGGLTAPVPVKFARRMGADIIIAVNISADPENQNAKTTTEILLQTFSIMGKTINQYALREADVVISPNLGGMKSSDFTRKTFAIQAGERATNALMPEILRKIQDKRIKMNQ